MERKDVKALVVMVMVLGMLAGQTTASFKDCYVQCFIFCVIRPDQSAFSCSLQCLKDCIIPTSSLMHQSSHSVTYYYCNLGCASSLCSNLSTRQNPGAKEVEGCVNSCSQTCTKNY